MTEIELRYSAPQLPAPIIISEEHITNLNITPETVLLVRVPMATPAAEGERIFNTIRQVVQKKTGIDPGILMIARDCELSELDIEALSVLRAEIDATLQYKLGAKGN